MLSLIFALVGCSASYTLFAVAWPSHMGWGITVSALVFIGIFASINYVVNKKLEVIFKSVQEAITRAQGKLQREATMYAQKGMASPKLQAKLEGELRDAIHGAVALLDGVKPLCKWGPVVGRQADTMKAQLLYQIKDYDAADPLLERALAFDPMIVAMKMARCYKHGKDKEVAKLFKSGLRRFKGDRKVLLYALYSWILVQQNRLEEAVVVLDEGKTKTDSPVLKENWEHLANNRVKRFSNADLAEAWYSLNLEEPKQVRVRQNSASPFGMSRHFR